MSQLVMIFMYSQMLSERLVDIRIKSYSRRVNGPIGAFLITAPPIGVLSSFLQGPFLGYQISYGLFSLLSSVFLLIGAIWWITSYLKENHWLNQQEKKFLSEWQDAIGGEEFSGQLATSLNHKKWMITGLERVPSKELWILELALVSNWPWNIPIKYSVPNLCKVTCPASHFDETSLSHIQRALVDNLCPVVNVAVDGTKFIVDQRDEEMITITVPDDAFHISLPATIRNLAE